MTLSIDLLARGYFPKEVPPIFTTASLAAAVKAGRVVVPGGKRQWTRLQEYSLARPGGLRRVLGTPHPEHFIALAHALEAAWQSDVEPALKLGRFGATPLLPTKGERVFQVSMDDYVARRTAIRVGSRFIVKTDVQNFYSSIYTHSLPWALHGKAASKAALKAAKGRAKHTHGDILDMHVRSGQDGQTMGVPIGPDTSLVIAELLMVAVEQEIVRRLPNVQAARNYDDFEFACADLAEAEEVLHVIERGLHQFELSLNPKKTTIVRLPDVIDSLGIAELRRAGFGTGRSQRSDVTAFFDKIAHYMVTETDVAIGAYGLSRLRNIDLTPEAWTLCQSRAASMAVADTSLLTHYASVLAHFTALGNKVDSGLVKVVVDNVIAASAPYGRDHEVSWALWLALEYGIEISPAATRRLAEVTNSFCVLLAILAERRGLVCIRPRRTLWREAMTKDGLTGQNWLLSYEARQQGWMRSAGGGDHRDQHPVLQQMATAGVSFLDLSKTTTPVSKVTPSAIGGAYASFGSRAT